jgi:hypothetical protein
VAAPGEVEEVAEGETTTEFSSSNAKFATSLFAEEEQLLVTPVEA